MERVLLLLSAYCFSTVLFAAESERGVSPFDANPWCKERDVHPADPACILKDEGVPRQFYPPPTTVIPVPPSVPVTPPTPPVAQEGPRTTTRPGG